MTFHISLFVLMFEFSFRRRRFHSLISLSNAFDYAMKFCGFISITSSVFVITSFLFYSFRLVSIDEFNFSFTVKTQNRLRFNAANSKNLIKEIEEIVLLVASFCVRKLKSSKGNHSKNTSSFLKNQKVILK